jgi:hypothetical protein
MREYASIFSYITWSRLIGPFEICVNSGIQVSYFLSLNVLFFGICSINGYQKKMAGRALNRINKEFQDLAQNAPENA